MALTERIKVIHSVLQAVLLILSVVKGEIDCQDLWQHPFFVLFIFYCSETKGLLLSTLLNKTETQVVKFPYHLTKFMKINVVHFPLKSKHILIWQAVKLEKYDK